MALKAILGGARSAATGLRGPAGQSISVTGAALLSRRFADEAEPSGQEADLPPYMGPYERDLHVQIAHKRGMDIIGDPIFNRGTGFKEHHRERLGLRGLLPPCETTLETQMARLMNVFRNGISTPPPPEPITEQHIQQWLLLRDLHDRNETLYYALLVKHFKELAPIVYTPTVGWAALNYSVIHRRPRGFYFSQKDRAHFSSMLWNSPRMEVDAIVVTDGSRILGLGDLGIQGMAIPIGKLDLYVAAAGFHPDRVFPCIVDVGTDNVDLRNSTEYIGLRQPRTKGKEYFEIMDEFVSAVMARWPNAVLQFEDFNTKVARTLLERYRNHHIVFNDDIQGTAATALAGMYGAMRVLGRPKRAITEQTFVVCGAGSAGMGVVEMIAKGLERHGLPLLQARRRFWIFDQDGLVTTRRHGLDPFVMQFARPEEDMDGMKLLDVINRVKPTVLLGLTGAGKIWSRDVLRAMGEHNARPIIFPMSNPTSKMECTAKEAQEATGGRAIFASGSPQDPVKIGNRMVASSQANNMYIFPGLALGALLARSRVSDAMLTAAAEAIPDVLPDRVVQQGGVYPEADDIRLISAHVALAVIKQAHIEGHLRDSKLEFRLERGDEAVLQWILRTMYVPMYGPIVTLPPGVAE